MSKVKPRKPGRPIKRTAQEWFNAAWERAKIQERAQAKSRRSGGGSCLYSAQGSLPGCFIGVSMKPSHAAWFDSPAAMADGVGTTFVAEFLGKLIESPEGVDSEFLPDLQAIHDGVYPKQWEPALRRFAARYGLTIPGE